MKTFGPISFAGSPPDPEQIMVEARRLLAESDVTVLRCYEAGEPVPQAWVDYRAALRLAVGTGEGPLPLRPEYP